MRTITGAAREALRYFQKAECAGFANGLGAGVTIEPGENVGYVHFDRASAERE